MNYLKQFKFILLFILFIISFSTLGIFEYRASLYDRNVLPFFSADLPFGFEIKWYEADYHIYDKTEKYPIINANNLFPLGGSSYYKTDNVFVKTIISYSYNDEQLFVKIKTNEGGNKYLIIRNYLREGTITDFDILDESQFESSYFEWVRLFEKPFYIKMWPLFAILLLTIIFIILLIFFYQIKFYRS